MAAPIKFGVGQSVRRKEDDALIRGKGRYTDDVAPQPAMHALVLRSPHAHAKFTIDASKARGLPGVGADPDGGRCRRISATCRACSTSKSIRSPVRPIRSCRRTKCAMSATPSPSWSPTPIDQARDAIEAIEVNWTPLPAVVGLANAVKKGAPQVWPDHAGNVLFDVSIGDKKAAEAAFAKAHAVAEISIVNPRVVTNFMETRAAVCRIRRQEAIT